MTPALKEFSKTEKDRGIASQEEECAKCILTVFTRIKGRASLAVHPG